MSDNNDLQESKGESASLKPKEYFERRPHLSDLTGHLARLRPGHPAGDVISLLIGQLQNYERNPVVLKQKILISCQRIQEARQ